MAKESILEGMRESIVEGMYIEEVQKACDAATESKLSTTEILQEGLTKAMQIVGKKWDSGEIFLPEVLASAESMKAATEYMKPYFAEQGAAESKGIAVIGTIKGDIHNIGKNLVALFLELGGFEVYNLGEDVPAERFVETAVEHKADVVGSSAFVSAVAGEMHQIEEGLKEAGVRDSIFTMIGGAALDPEWATEIGADAYGKDALQATELATAFVDKKKG